MVAFFKEQPYPDPRPWNILADACEFQKIPPHPLRRHDLLVVIRPSQLRPKPQPNSSPDFQFHSSSRPPRLPPRRPPAATTQPPRSKSIHNRNPAGKNHPPRYAPAAARRSKSHLDQPFTPPSERRDMARSIWNHHRNAHRQRPAHHELAHPQQRDRSAASQRHI